MRKTSIELINVNAEQAARQVLFESEGDDSDQDGLAANRRQATMISSDEEDE